MLASLRIAVRSLVRRPAVAVVAVLSLAVGIGVNSAVFGIVDALTRPPSVDDPASLVTVAGHFRESGGTGISWPDYEDIRSQTSAFSELAAISNRGGVYRDGDEVVELPVTVTSDNYFPMLGVRPALGRFPEPGHNYDQDPEPPLTISHSFWQTRLGGRPDVIGHSIRLTGRLFQVAAVLPAAFRGLQAPFRVDIFMPVGAWTKAVKEKLEPGNSVYEGIGRLRSGTSFDQAQAQLDALSKRIEASDARVPRGRRLVVRPLDAMFRGLRLPGLLALAAVALVLLAACANVAGVLLVHADVRRREIGIRMAVGASRMALARQFLTESGVLAAGGAALGLLLAQWLLMLIPALLPSISIPIDLDIRVDHRFMTYTALAAIAAVLLSGIAPILHSVRWSLLDALAGGRAAGGSRRGWLQTTFVAAQVAISVVLVSGALFLLGRLADARAIYVGLDSHRPMALCSFYFEPGGDRSKVSDRAVQRIQVVPGVEAVTFVRHVPLQDWGGGASVAVLPEGAPAGAVPMQVYFNLAGPRYFETVGARMLRGRTFTAGDHQTAAQVAIVSASGAARFWPGQDPMGKMLRVDGRSFQVVGVAEDARNSSIHEESKPYIYFPYSTMRSGEATFVVVTKGDPAPMLKPVAHAVAATGELGIIESVTLRTHMSNALYLDWMPSVLGGGLFGVGLLLAAGGLYGAVAYAASRRRREFGVRLAMGARGGEIFRLVLRQAGQLCGAGVPVGCLIFALLWHYGGGALFNETPSAWAMAAGAAITCLVVLAGALVPALRAARLDPNEILREE